MSQVDLLSVFKAVTDTLQENQTNLNEADTYNHDHGDHMVQTFQTITKAAARSTTKTPSAQLDAASRSLSKSTSGSAQIYAQGLKKASQDFKGKDLTADNVGMLINSLMGMGGAAASTQPSVQNRAQASGGDLLSTLLGSLLGQGSTQQNPQPQQQTGNGDLLGDLLGGLMGSQTQEPAQEAERQGQLRRPKTEHQTPQQQTPQQGSSGDLFGDRLGGLLGGGGSSSQQETQSTPEDVLGDLLSGTSNPKTKESAQAKGLDLGGLLSTGLAYYAAKKGGKSNLEAIMAALSKSSPLASTPARTQSGALIINTILAMLGGAR